MAHIGKELRFVLACDLKLPALVVNLIEEPHVLNGDRSLVGERFNQSNLVFGELSDLFQHINAHDAKQVLTFENRDRQNCPIPFDVFGTVRIFRIGQDIRNVNSSAFERRTTGSAAPAGTNWILGYKIFETLWSIEGRRHPQQLTI